MEQICPAGKRDLNDIEALYNALTAVPQTVAFCGWRQGVYPTRQTAQRAMEKGTLFVLRLQGRLAGAVIVDANLPKAYEEAQWSEALPPGRAMTVHTLAVHPEFTHRGVGARLFGFALRQASLAGCRALRLDTLERNTPAAHLYESWGCRFAGIVDLKLQIPGLDTTNLNRFRCYEKPVFHYGALKEELSALAEPEYREFSAGLTPGCGDMLGVRVPKLRALAKRLAKEDWRGYLAAARDSTFEEIMLRGLVLGAAKMNLPERLGRLEEFVPKINNWAVCDVCSSSFRFVLWERAAVYRFLQPYIVSENEFDCRFAAVMLMDYFLTEEYIGRVLEILENMRHPGYYCRMAVAWALSVCFVKFPQQTTAWLKQSKQDDWTYNKAIQKICESRRVSAETKEWLRTLKRGVRKNK